MTPLFSLVFLFSVAIVCISAKYLPEIGFGSGYGSNPKLIALTFDDGPEPYGWTASLVNQLASMKVPACFFINSNNWIDINNSPEQQETIRNLIKSGLCLGSHTAHHADLTLIDNSTIIAELDGVEQAVHKIVPDYRITLFRAPYGTPYQAGTQSQINAIRDIIGRRYVEVGWQSDSKDYNCGSADCIVNSTIAEIDSGRYGVMLFHAVNQYTPQALPRIVNTLKSRGFTLVSVDDLLVNMYGKTSLQMWTELNVNTDPDPNPNNPLSSSASTLTHHIHKPLFITLGFLILLFNTVFKL